MKPTSATLVFCVVLLLAPVEASAELKAGAAVVDVTPPQLPVLVNGGMLSRSAESVKAPVNARAIVLDDGHERLGIVVVDSCMMPRPLLDEAKSLAAQQTKIRADRMLISATHSHSAPSSVGALGTDADPNYVQFLREKLAEAHRPGVEITVNPGSGWSCGGSCGTPAQQRHHRSP